jgi:hypothetical protein
MGNVAFRVDAIGNRVKVRWFQSVQGCNFACAAPGPPQSFNETLSGEKMFQSAQIILCNRPCRSNMLNMVGGSNVTLYCSKNWPPSVGLAYFLIKQ